MLLILDRALKPVTTDDFDNFVCAELPHRNNDSDLYETITNTTINDFFALLLVHCEIPHCYHFFERHKHHMIDERQGVHNDSEFLRLLDQSLQCNGTSLLKIPTLP